MNVRDFATAVDKALTEVETTLEAIDTAIDDWNPSSGGATWTECITYLNCDTYNQKDISSTVSDYTELCIFIGNSTNGYRQCTIPKSAIIFESGSNYSQKISLDGTHTLQFYQDALHLYWGSYWSSTYMYAYYR